MQAEFYIPQRLEEGYGLNNDALARLAAGGAQVIVTVDCGIASLNEADEALRLGIELIVTDHHEMKDRLPAAAVCVHPRLPGCDYPFGGLSGAGVAFKLAWALAVRHCGSEKVTDNLRNFLLDALCMATLGLVADVVPLCDENRILVRAGLNRSARNRCSACGWIESARFPNGDPAEDIAFAGSATQRRGPARLCRLSWNCCIERGRAMKSLSTWRVKTAARDQHRWFSRRGLDRTRGNCNPAA